MKRLKLDCDNLIKRYVGGESEYSLALSLGVSRQVIRTRLLDAGVEIRNRSAAGIVRARKMSAAERAAQTAAANAAARGRTQTIVERFKMARSRQNSLSSASAAEFTLVKMLRERGINDITQQLAIGPYNTDIAVYPVAVEVFGGQFHWHGYHLARTPKRFRYILNSGWHILCVAVTESFPLTAEVADYVAAYIDSARRNPTGRREYRVVWGANEFSVSGRADDDEISIKPPFTNRRDPATGRYVRVAR